MGAAAASSSDTTRRILEEQAKEKGNKVNESVVFFVMKQRPYRSAEPVEFYTDPFRAMRRAKKLGDFYRKDRITFFVKPSGEIK